MRWAGCSARRPRRATGDDNRRDSELVARAASGAPVDPLDLLVYRDDPALHLASAEACQAYLPHSSDAIVDGAVWRTGEFGLAMWRPDSTSIRPAT